MMSEFLTVECSCPEDPPLKLIMSICHWINILATSHHKITLKTSAEGMKSLGGGAGLQEGRDVV